VWGKVLEVFDGNWVDLGTLLVAVSYACYIRPKHQPLISKKTGLRVAHGVALFPLFLLACSSISSSALNALLHSHKIILSVAGVVALLAILEEDPPI
jgi:EamA domain-containing membrane protein RarD